MAVGMPFPLLPTPKAETSEPSPSMPTKILRNQCNSRRGEDMWGLAQAKPLASVPFPTLPRALHQAQSLGPVCFRVYVVFSKQEYPEELINRCPINSSINSPSPRLLPVDLDLLPVDLNPRMWQSFFQSPPTQALGSRSHLSTPVLPLGPKPIVTFSIPTLHSNRPLKGL